MADSGSYNVGQLFDTSKTANQDYAIRLLHEIFGSAMDKLSNVPDGVKVTYSSGNTLVTNVISTMNLMVLFCAVVVASYLIYTSVFNTAKDGEVMGKTMDTRYTSLRAFLAIFGLVPLSSGFSVVQILVLQLLVFGSSAADYAWTKVVDNLMTNSAAYVSNDTASTAWVGNNHLAATFDQMVRGQLCRLYANRISDTTQSGSNPIPPAVIGSRASGFFDSSSPNTGSTLANDLATATAWQWGFFASGDAPTSSIGYAYDQLTSMCGIIDVYYNAPSSALTNTQVTSELASFQSSMTAIAQGDAANAAKQALESMSEDSLTIATAIFNGNRDTTTLKAQIAADLQKASRAFYTATGTSTDAQSTLTSSFRSATINDGWVFAGVWQRALSELSDRVAAAKSDVSFTWSGNINPKKAGSLRAQYFGWAGGGSAEEKAVFAQIDDAYAYLGNFQGVYQQIASPIGSTSKTMLERVNDADNKDSITGKIVQWLYNDSLYQMETPKRMDGWTDPILTIQKQGRHFMMASAAITAAAEAAPTAGAVAGGMVGAEAGPLGGWFGYKAGKAVQGMLYPVAKIFLVLGFVAMVILPFLPLAYYMSGVFAWIIMAVEALVAISLWCLLALTPSRADSLVGDNRQGLTLLIAVFLRPILMIVGLMFCYVLMFVGIQLLDVLFGGVFMLMAPGESIWDILTAAGMLGMYMLMVSIVVMFCCSLITGLGDGVMAWIGVQTGMLGKNAIADNFSNIMNPSGITGGQLNQIGSGVGRGARAGYAGGDARQEKWSANAEAASRAGRDAPALPGEVGTGIAIARRFRK